MKKLLFLLIFIATDLIIVNAQRPAGRDFPSRPGMGVIKGQIIEADLNQLMEYVNIVLFNQKDSTMVTGAVTSQDGKFELSGIQMGNYYLKVSFIGYNDNFYNNIQITPKQTIIDIGKILLKAAATNLNGVEIVADKQHVVYQLDKKIVNVSQDIMAQGGTAIDALENVPSVQVDIDGNVSLRGSANFTLLIDGHPSVLDNVDALQQIPASTIDRIEIITNPSAKYDPDGTAGIINVIMKKNIKSGLNGIINASVGTGNKYSGNLLLNYKVKKVNFYGGIDYNNNHSTGKGTSMTETYLVDTTNYRNTDSERKSERDGYSARAGLDYSLSDKTTLSLSGRYGHYNSGMDNFAKRYIYTIPSTTNDYSYSDNSSNRKGDFYEATGNFLHRFNDNGHTLEAMAFFSQRIGNDGEIQSNYITDQNWNIIDQNPDINRTSEDDHSREFRLKADYSHPVGAKGKLESGYQSRIQLQKGTYLFQNYDYASGLYIDNPLYSSQMDFRESIQSLYATYSNEWTGFNYQLGLRTEYTDRRIEDIQSPSPYVLTLWDFFPTVHLSRGLPLEQEVMVSYSRRINRPHGWDLDPFPNYMDPYNIRIGNPDLKPEYIDSYELGYQKKFNESFVALDAYYRITKNKMDDVTTLRSDGVMVHTEENLNKDYSLGAELSSDLVLTKWLELFGSVDIYHYRLVGTVDNQSVDNQSLNWEGRFNATVKLKGDLRFQLTTRYEGPSVEAQGKEKGSFMANLAVKKDFLKRKLTATLSARDLFKTAKHESTSWGQGFYSYNRFTREAPVIMFTLSYKLNNYKKEQEKPENGEERPTEDEINY